MNTSPQLHSRQDVVSAFAGRWRQGDRTPAREFLSEHPALRGQKSVVLDLVLEEASLRRESGETVFPSTLCEQFPAYRHSLQRLLAVRRHLGRKSVAEAAAVAIVEATPIRWPEPGESFLGFELLEELGQGSFARVYLARQEELGGRLVALKVARHGAGEAKTLGRLRHDYIVPVHSIDTDPVSGLTAVCMTYLGRATLLDLLDAAFVERLAPTTAEVIVRVAAEAEGSTRGDQRETPAATVETYVDGVARLVCRLAEALAYSHEVGIVHRDLKPSNVLLGLGGIPMLLDFNLSTDSSNESIAVAGTVAYMPPELLGLTVDKDRVAAVPHEPRSDVFSLGVMFYELLTGSLPFGEPEGRSSLEESAREMLEKVRQTLRPAAQRNPQVTPALDKIVARCLAGDLGDRYASAAALAADLKEYLSPERRAQVHLMAHRRSRRRAMLAGAGAVTASLVVFGGWSVYQAATRLPEFEQGILEYERGYQAAAIACFDRHLKAHPNDAAALFARGQSKRKSGDLAAAEVDYLAAAKLSKSGLPDVCAAYCLAKRTVNEQAIAMNLIALNKGFDSAALRNNLARLQIEKSHYADARRNLNVAIAHDGRLYAARHNRGRLELKEAILSSRQPSTEALCDIDLAFDLGPVSTQLLADAACLHALAAKENPSELVQAERLLVKALESGLASNFLIDSPVSQLANAPQIRALLNSRRAVSSTTADLLAPPPFDVRLENNFGGEERLAFR